MNYDDERELDRNSVFHERIDILKDQGYRGYSITGSQKKWGGVEVHAKNSAGHILKASGETDEEAYKKMIDLIEHTVSERSEGL
ncbi:MAG: hypothetical protein WD599_01385 [Balneolaceae bacterium]